jgi:TIR domain-containing protein
MAHVFISYARADRALVKLVREELGKGRRKHWIDVDGITPGGDWRQAIDDALRKAAAVVVILSPQSSKSAYVTYEWSFALGSGIRVIPLLAKPAKVHPRLETLQHIDFTHGKRAWGQLIEAVKHRSTSRPPRRRESKPPTIYAEFELEGGKPREVDESYRIWISTKNVPRGTERVAYEILDDSFPQDERKFSVDWGPRDFMDWITSYGDILLTAKGKGALGRWRTQSTLAEALRRKYGTRPPAVVRRALTDIENN